MHIWGGNSLRAGTLTIPGLVGTPDVSVGVPEDPTEIRLAAIDGVRTAWHSLTGTTQTGNDNIVTILGFNVDATGSRVDTARHAWWAQLEYEYLTGGNRLTEAHWCEYRSSDGLTSRRPISTTIDISTHVVNNYMAGITTWFDKTSTNQLAKIYDGTGSGQGIVELFGDGWFLTDYGGGYLGRDSVGTARFILWNTGDGSNTIALRAHSATGGVECRSLSDVVRIKWDNTGIGMYGVTPAVQGAVGASLTNSVTSGGTVNVINNITAASVDTSAAKLTDTRDAMYRLTEKVAALEAKLKLLGAVKD